MDSITSILNNYMLARLGQKGCRNYPENCDFDGYRPYQYSPEGYCVSCEFDNFPDRFAACPLCRFRRKKLGVCITCNYRFKKWLKEHIEPKLTNKIISDLMKHLETIRMPPLSKSYAEWPGFYLGTSETECNRWCVPDIKIYVTQDIQSISELDKILQNHGIYIFEEIQLKYDMPAKFIVS